MKNRTQRDHMNTPTRQTNSNSKTPGAGTHHRKIITTEARKAAKQIGRTAHARKGIAEDLARVLAAFGGHITRIELPAQ